MSDQTPNQTLPSSSSGGKKRITGNFQTTILSEGQLKVIKYSVRYHVQKGELKRRAETARDELRRRPERQQQHSSLAELRETQRRTAARIREGMQWVEAEAEALQRMRQFTISEPSTASQRPYLPIRPDVTSEMALEIQNGIRERNRERRRLARFGSSMPRIPRHNSGRQLRHSSDPLPVTPEVHQSGDIPLSRPESQQQLESEPTTIPDLLMSD